MARHTYDLLSSHSQLADMESVPALKMYTSVSPTLMVMGDVKVAIFVSAPATFSFTETASIVAATLPVFLIVTRALSSVSVVLPHSTTSIRTCVWACCDCDPIIDMTHEYAITEAATAMAMSNNVAIKGLIALTSLRSLFKDLSIDFISSSIVHTNNTSF